MRTGAGTGNPEKRRPEHYADLLVERKDDPCTEYEQRHGAKVNEFRENPVGVNAVAAAPAEEPLGEGRLFHAARKDIMWLYVPAGLICPAPHVGPIH